MAATIQHDGLVHYLLIAYCPQCGQVVESQVLSWYPPCTPDGVTVQPLAPDVLMQVRDGCLLWMHVRCGGVLVQVSSLPMVMAPIE